MGRTGCLLFCVSCIKLLLLCVNCPKIQSYLDSNVSSRLATQSLKLRIIITNDVTNNIYATMFLIMMGEAVY